LEPILAGMAILVVLLVPVGWIISFVSISRTTRLRREVEERLWALEVQVGSLARALRERGPMPASAAASPPQGAPRPEGKPHISDVPSPPPQTDAAATPTPVVRPEVASPMPSPVQGVAPPVGVPAPSPEPHRPVASPRPSPEAPPPAGPTPRPPTPPPARRPPSTPPPKGPSFDWESLLGVKGAAWVGGFVLVIAAILLAKLAIDQGLFTPELRVTMLIMAGVGSLVWAELSLRRGYAITSNAVSGAGIATLYVAFFAGHSLYHFFSLLVTFALLALVTVVAGILAIRYDALFTAILGLLGGFATPLALSTGHDQPVGLFSYIFLLNLGLFWVALKKRWHSLAILGLAGTSLIEAAWFFEYMAPQKMLVGSVVFFGFGILYLVLPELSPKDKGSLGTTGILGGVVPFLFAFMIAGNPAYAGEWPLLFALVGLLDIALGAVAILRGPVWLLLSGALATAVTLPLWALQGLTASSLWGPTLGALAIGAILNLPGRFGNRLPQVREGEGVLGAAGLIAGAGLGCFTLVMVVREMGEPPWPFLALLAGLTLILFERSRAEIPGLRALGAIALAVLIQIWFFVATSGGVLLRNLSVGLLFTMALSLVSARKAREARGEAEVGVIAASLIAMMGLFACLLRTELARDPLPILLAAALLGALLMMSSLRQNWTQLLTIVLVSLSGLCFIWQEAYFQKGDAIVVLPFYVLFYLALLALPFLLPSAWRARLRDAPMPWFTSALAGPAFFLPIHAVWVACWGKEAIGLLPVGFAALSVVGLSGIDRFFSEHGLEARLRLRYLALFAALALGFVALAIPLQLNRQWITLGWALEAAAVWWLFPRLPHPGLKYFGALLYMLVSVRLLLNFDNVLHYQTRGAPIFNWILYTYGVPALCFFVGAHFLGRVEAARRRPEEMELYRGQKTILAPAVSFLGLLLVFALINLEIADYFSENSSYVEVSFEHKSARDLTTSGAWAAYSMVLLAVGTWRKGRALRFISLGFLMLTVAKVFLYDLSNLEGVSRVLSFLGLGISLILVSLFYQRFVFSKERT